MAKRCLDMSRKYMDRNWLYQKYWIDELSSYEMGRICGVYNQTILYRMKKLGVPIRDRIIAIRLMVKKHPEKFIRRMKNEKRNS
mgnify:CR=1 FL=1